MFLKYINIDEKMYVTKQVDISEHLSQHMKHQHTRTAIEPHRASPPHVNDTPNATTSLRNHIVAKQTFKGLYERQQHLR